VPILTLAIITTAANKLDVEIRNRMPLILKLNDYIRWLGVATDPHGLLRQHPAEPMRMWPISTRVS
jgi:putative SOS response-associated peptidase YedK